jgi:hypothetical protein
MGWSSIQGAYNEPSFNSGVSRWLVGWKHDGGKGGEVGEAGESHTVPSVTIERMGQNIVLPEITIKGGEVGAAVSVLPNKSVTIAVNTGTMKGGTNQNLS